MVEIILYKNILSEPDIITKIVWYNSSNSSKRTVWYSPSNSSNRTHPKNVLSSSTKCVFIVWTKTSSFSMRLVYMKVIWWIKVHWVVLIPISYAMFIGPRSALPITVTRRPLLNIREEFTTSFLFFTFSN